MLFFVFLPRIRDPPRERPAKIVIWAGGRQGRRKRAGGRAGGWRGKGGARAQGGKGLGGGGQGDGRRVAGGHKNKEPGGGGARGAEEATVEDN